MRDSSLLIVIIGAFLVSVCSSDSQSFDKSTEDGVVRMASEALVVKSYKEAESSTASTTKSQASRFEEFQIYQGVMGRPGIDFPVYPHIPATSFTCRGVKKSGYYADLETDCQVFHICDGNRKISFLCPNGTIFRQSHLICDWWFRVDCGKSVELYEESAEQLAADQKIYKARSEERERRRKLGKTAAENGEEVTSSEVYALDEPFHVRNRQQERKNQLGSITTRAPPSRNAFEGRKAERHSKKVVDSAITEKFPNFSREKQNGRVTEKTRTTKPDGRIGATTIPVNTENRAKVSFIDTPATPSVESTTAHKGRQHTPNSISFVNNKENIQPAESGSLVEDLKQRTGNFVYNYRTGSEVSKNFAYNTNSKINQTVEFGTNYSRNTDRVAGEVYNAAFEAQNGGSSGTFGAQNGGSSGTFTAQNGGNSGAFVAQSGGSSGAFGAQNGGNSGAFVAQSGGSSGTFGAQNGGNSGAFVAQSGGSSGTFAAQNGGNSGAFVAQSGGSSGTFGAQSGESSGTFTAQNGGNSGAFVAQNGGSSGAFVAQNGRSSGTLAAQNGGSDEYNNRNINFNYNDRRTGEQTSRLKVAYNDGRTRKTAFENSNQKTETPNDFDVTAYTTEFFNYESKRTNFVDRQETITPTFQTTKILQSSKYRSTTPAPVEPERQFFAETASFASNRGGKSYSDFQNQYNSLQKGIVTTTTTASPYKTTLQNTFPTTQSRYSTNFNFDQNSYRTSTYRPVKQHSRRVTTYPTTQPQTTFATRIWQTTTSQPFVETTTNERFTVEDIYFTTSTQEREVESATEIQSFGSTPKPDVDITLQELNINKTPQPATGGNVSYDDLVREGLEVPPSSGPNAIRTFALYFATTNSNQEEGRTTTYLRTNDSELTTTLTPFEIKKKEVVKQVDELVQRSSLNTSDHVSQSEELPNSLTHHTQNSYSALFPVQQEENHTSAPSAEGGFTEIYETTAFESFTEEPNRINKELTKNDLDGSQSRGLVEPDTDYGKVSPDLRELAQVFTKALSAYLDDPEAFRRVLSEIRPTEPTDSEVSSSNPLEYPSATQEDDEVLDFSDVTKSSYKKKTSTAYGPRETTTVFSTDAPVTNGNEIENLVLPINHTSWATNLELTAPLFESLDQSQSSYYTPPSYTSTTNAIAEEINNEFTASDRTAPVDSNEAIDSYFPVRDNNDASSLPRYGGFQNNSKSTTKYSPYGAELTSTTYRPYGADLTTTAVPNGATTNIDVTTFNPNNVTSFFSHFAKNESEEGEIQLAKELNNLVLLQKFTTPRGSERELTTPEPSLSTVHLTSQNDVNVFQDVKLGNGEILEKSVRSGKALQYPETTLSSNQFEPDAKEINLELSPPSSTPKGFLITYSIGASSSEPATYLPKATTPVVHPTTFSPSRQTTYIPAEDTYPPATDPQFENFSERLERLTNGRTSAYRTTTPPATTTLFFKSTNSFERLAQLQETLMFNSNNVTLQQRDQARVSVVEMIDKMNMTDSTASTLMKMMEMAAKNETYRRLVLLLVNDKSGKNKTVEESRLDLLKALLTPVINPPRTVVPIPETSRLVQTEQRRRSISRRGKSITSDNAINAGTLTTTTIAPKKSSGERKTKKGRGLARAESNYSSGLGNLGVIKRTIENSKNKQVRINSLDDAILDSDSRAVDLLRSLYSLAARWG